MKVQEGIDVLNTHFQETVVTVAKEHNDARKISNEVATKLARSTMFLEYLHGLLFLLEEGVDEIKFHFAQCVAMVNTPTEQRGAQVMALDLDTMKRNCCFQYEIPSHCESLYDVWASHLPRDPVLDEKEIRESEETSMRQMEQIQQTQQAMQMFQQIIAAIQAAAQEEESGDDDSDDDE